ncbi:MAG TPA: hypothetical protein VGD94_22660 [Vicinamibacterales bacterium]
MNTRLLLGSSAVVMGIAGIAASFLPQELLARLEVVPTAALTVLVQLFGALLFAFALVNWTAKGAPMGGIYGRPIALGNLTHFLVGALALLKSAMNGASDPLIIGAGAVYIGFAISFGIAFFQSPV